MKVASIKISNILGIEHVEIKPGAVTVIGGANSTGKTSILEAIRGALGGSHDATLLRKGTEGGEVVLVLEDGVQISKKITAEKSSLTVRHPEFGKITKAQGYIDKLLDVLSLNPVEFLTARPDKRAEILLEALPMKLTQDQFGQVLPLCINPPDPGAHALKVLAAAGKDLYDQRTGINRAAKEKKATAEQMKQALPPEPEEGDWNQKFDGLRAELQALQSETQGKLDRVKANSADEASKIRSDHAGNRERILAEVSARIEALRREADQQISISESRRDAELHRVDAQKTERLSALEGEYRPKHEELSEELAHAKEMVEATARSEEARKFIANLEADVAKLEGQSKRLTAGLEQLDAIKVQLLEKLPIKGIEIRDGEIYVDGVVFDRTNEARKVQIAIEIAKKRAGSLGLVAVDGLERLDSATFDAFRKQAVKSGLQFIVSRVTDGELSISTEREEVAVNG